MDLGSADAFDRMGTIGVEEEFFVVDESGRPTSGTDELVYESTPPDVLQGRLDHELFKFVIETQTPTCDSMAEAEDQLCAVRDALVDHAEEHGFQIAGAGLHPIAIWRELEHAEKSRYRAQLDRIQYPQHRNTTAGLHVHVGVDDADKATWIANELRWHIPVMLALSVNSPYWNGFDTGLESARAKIFEGLPNTGIPTAFVGFEDYAAFERRMVESGSINDRGELWYDVRPHSGHGTVEIRAPDGQSDPDRVIAFVEYTEALVRYLAERYEDASDPWAVYNTHDASRQNGPVGHNERRELLDENKWRALRYGHDALLLDRGFEEPVPLGEIVDREASRLGVTGIQKLYDSESGATYQRRLREQEGISSLCRALLL